MVEIPLHQSYLIDIISHCTTTKPWRAICETERALTNSSNNNKSLNSNILSSNSVNQHAKSQNLYHKFKDG